MAPEFFLKGLIIGFSIAAPVGPIGVLCIQRTLSHGRASGFASGLGAATADAAYGFVAAFGLTFISSFLVAEQLWLRLIGGAFLLWLGIRSFRAQPADPAAGEESAKRVAARSTIAGAYGSTVLLTLANPATILSFVAVFAGLGVGAGSGSSQASYESYGMAAILVLGVFLGSALWWLILSWVAGFFRGRVGMRHLVWINRFSGAILAIFGIAAMASLLFAK